MGFVLEKNKEDNKAIATNANQVIQDTNNIKNEEVAAITNNVNNSPTKTEIENKANNVNGNKTSSPSSSTEKFKPEDFQAGTYTYGFVSENGITRAMSIVFGPDNKITLSSDRYDGFYAEGTYEIKYNEEGGLDLPGDVYVINCTIDKWNSEPSGEYNKKAFSPGHAQMIILDKDNILISYMQPMKWRDETTLFYFGEGVKFTFGSGHDLTETDTKNNTKKFNIENFKTGTYVYSVPINDDLSSGMAIRFNNDNTVVFGPPFSNGLSIEGTYEIEHQEEPGLEIPGDIYIIKCIINKWSYEPSGEINQKAFSPGYANIIILDEENVMIENMSPIKIRENSTGFSFGEGVKFTLKK